MSEKIKSITITQPLKATFYTTGTTKIEKDGNGFCITGDNLEIFIRPTSVETVEYEQDEPEKPGQLFYPNGACVRELEKETLFTYISSDGSIRTKVWENDKYDLYLLQSQNAFLTEKAAEKAKSVQDTHNRILAKVMEINAEQGWVADWESFGQKKYYVAWDHDHDTKNCGCAFDWQRQSLHMSEQAKDWLMSDDVSDQDFKHFLFIYE